jgi:tetratricopeptide (TPR) repeat protein
MRKQLISLLLCWVCVLPLVAQESPSATIFAKAENLRSKGMFIEAIAEYDKACALEPKNSDFFYYKGYCALQLKDYQVAIATLGQALLIKPNHLLANKALIRCYAQLGDKNKQKEALQACIAVLINEDERYELYKELIALNFDTDNYDKVLELIAKAKQLNLGRNDPWLDYLQASIYNSRGDYTLAVELMSKTIELFKVKDPERQAKFYYELGYALHRLGRYQESIEVLKNANYGKFKPLVAKLNPSYYLQAAICYMNINDFDLSKTYLLKALKMKPDFSAAYLNLGKIAEREADQSEAIEHYQSALISEKNNQRIAVIYENLAQLYLDNRMYDKAIAACDEYLKINPKNYVILFEKSIALYKQQKYIAAITILETISNITSLDENTRSKYYFALGIAYIHSEKSEDAKRALRNVVSEGFKSVAQIILEELSLKASSEFK